jgi:hypothetical protein
MENLRLIKKIKYLKSGGGGYGKIGFLLIMRVELK